MTSESQPQRNPVPPPPPVRHNRHELKRKKRRKKLLIVGISTGFVLALIGSGAGIAFSNNADKLETYNETLEEVSSTHGEAVRLLQRGLALEPDLQERFEAQMATAASLIEADPPSVMSFTIDSRIEDLAKSGSELSTSYDELQAAIDDRGSYMSASSKADDALEEAQELLKQTKDKVLDDEAYKELSGHVEALKEALESAPDSSSAAAYADSAALLEEVTSNISESSTAVSTSHEEWEEAEKKAKEDAEKRDPANYKKISDRDWQLIERSPFSHYGDKYVVYGAVSQADSNTGILSIRVDTGGAKKSRQYDYDVNTYVSSGDFGMFSDIVQGDHVKMLVEVTGSKTYSTQIGGSATAVEVTAYDIEVLGQF